MLSLNYCLHSISGHQKISMVHANLTNSPTYDKYFEPLVNLHNRGISSGELARSQCIRDAFSALRREIGAPEKDFRLIWRRLIPTEPLGMAAGRQAMPGFV